MTENTSNPWQRIFEKMDKSKSNDPEDNEFIEKLRDAAESARLKMQQQQQQIASLRQAMQQTQLQNTQVFPKTGASLTQTWFDEADNNKMKENSTMTKKMIFPTLSPTLLLGPPGIGKTARVKEAFPYTVVIPTSGWSDEDLNGLPYRDGEVEKRTLPLWYTNLMDQSAFNERVCLFFDEIDKTPVSVANTLLTLIESRRHGNIVLPVNCAIVAAANSRGEISDALWERFSKIDCTVDFLSTIDFLDRKVKSQPARLFVDALRQTKLPLVSRTDVKDDAERQRSLIPRTCELFIHACNEYPDDLVSLIEYAKGLFPHREVSKIQNFFAKSEPHEKVSEKANLTLNRKGAIRI